MQLKSSVLPLLALVSLAAANPLHLAGYGEVNLDALVSNQFHYMASDTSF
jgi:hypothetical protein